MTKAPADHRPARPTTFAEHTPLTCHRAHVDSHRHPEALIPTLRSYHLRLRERLRKPYFVRLERKQDKVRGQESCWVSARIYTGFHRADKTASCSPLQGGTPATALRVRWGLSQGAGAVWTGTPVEGVTGTHRGYRRPPSIAHDKHTPHCTEGEDGGGSGHPLPASVSSSIKQGG